MTIRAIAVLRRALPWLAVLLLVAGPARLLAQDVTATPDASMQAAPATERAARVELGPSIFIRTAILAGKCYPAPVKTAFMIPNEWLTALKLALSLNFLLPILRRFAGQGPSWRFEALPKKQRAAR